MTIRQAVSWGSDKLKSHGVENAEHDSFELLSAVNGMTRTFYLVNGDSSLSEEDFLLFEEYIDKRAAHIPLQHIIGKAYFYGYEFEVNGDVLVPRQDTEILVGEVMKVARSGDYILDMCTGSGCIGITIAKKFPEVKVLGIDVSEKALAVAEKNKHNLEADNIDFMLSDLFEKLNSFIFFTYLSNYCIFTNISVSFNIRYFLSSILSSVPANLLYITLSPTDTVKGSILPSFKTLPSPTATTVPSSVLNDCSVPSLIKITPPLVFSCFFFISISKIILSPIGCNVIIIKSLSFQLKFVLILFLVFMFAMLHLILY